MGMSSPSIDLDWLSSGTERLSSSRYPLHRQLKGRPGSTLDLDLGGDATDESSGLGDDIARLSALANLEPDRLQLVPDIMLDKPTVVEGFAPTIEDPGDRNG